MFDMQPVRMDEAEEIARFMERVIGVSVDASLDEKAAFVANTRENLEKWRDNPDRSFHSKCQIDGQLAGVVLVRDFWNLCHLFVAPEHQLRGVGRALLDAAASACSGKSPRGMLRLNASRNAVAFYRHMGFSEVTDAPEPYRGIQFERRI